MKILVNLSVLAHDMSGIGRFTMGLLRELIVMPDVEELYGFYSGKLLTTDEVKIFLDSFSDESRKTVSAAPWIKKVASEVPGSRKLLYLYRSLRAQSVGKKLEGFIYWEPGFIAHPLNMPTYITVHDLSHIDHPEFHPEGRVDNLNALLPKSMQSCSGIITVSEFSRNRIIKQFGEDRPVRVVYPGVDASFFDVTGGQMLTVRAALKLPRRYILAVSTFEPRKNLAKLLDAFFKIPPYLREQYPLVLAGCNGWKTGPLEDRISELEKTGHVIRLGFVPQSYLPALYAAATISLYVSLYEGFGMPIAEAMATGTPVITSNRTSMPEVAGNAAMLVDPDSADEIARAIESLLADKVLYQQLGERGRERSRKYSWQASAAALVESFRK
jgi:alpha-1,3-rhamnosyl/mannosyltransferase